MTSNTLIIMSNQLKRVTSRVHTILGLLCWMNERYTHIRYIIPSFLCASPKSRAEVPCGLQDHPHEERMTCHWTFLDQDEVASINSLGGNLDSYNLMRTEYVFPSNLLLVILLVQHWHMRRACLFASVVDHDQVLHRETSFHGLKSIRHWSCAAQRDYKSHSLTEIRASLKL